jgi:hypothetical protein
MEGYLGEFDVDIKDTPYANYTPNDWVLEYLFKYSQIEGQHHKQWVLDQTARILHGTPVIIKLAGWSNGEKEYRFRLGEATQEYLEWVKMYRGEYDEEEGCYEYNYDEGIAP